MTLTMIVAAWAFAAADPGAGQVGYWVNSGVLTYRNDDANEVMNITSVSLA